MYIHFFFVPLIPGFKIYRYEGSIKSINHDAKQTTIYF